MWRRLVPAFVIVAGAFAAAGSDASAHCTVAGTCHDALDDCVNAPIGFWSDGEICWPCLAGEYAGTTMSMACTACPAGSFAPAIASAACTPCAAGSYAASAGATACVACPACDDANDCTTDRCDPAIGCVNERTASCPDAGSMDAGTIDAGSMDAGNTGDVDGGGPPPVTGGGGCAVSNAGVGFPAVILTAVGVLLAARRRKRCEASRA